MSSESSTASPQTNINGASSGVTVRVSRRWQQIQAAAARLHELLSKHRGDRLLILIQDFPDPDALSSAWAFELIAQRFDIQCEIIYAGTLSHQENIALVKLTNLPAHRLSVAQLKQRDLSIYDGCVLVDGQGSTSQLVPPLREANIPIVAIIDHHQPQGNPTAEYVDLRPDTRATATILTEYLQAGALDLDPNDKEHVRCATALMHGIRSDTNGLTLAQEDDFFASAFLSRFYDAPLLNAILQSTRSRQVMEIIERALHQRAIKNSFSLSGVGYLRYDDRDAIPQAADFLLTEENIHTVLVYGLVYDEDEEFEAAMGSLRTRKLTLDPDEFIKEALGQDAQGRFFGGGRASAGGFEIPLGFLKGFNDRADYARLKWEVLDLQIQQKFYRLIQPDDESISTH